MPRVKPLSRISEKWLRQSQAAQPEYIAGINDPKNDWADATAAAESSYESGVQAAIGRKAFGKGVRRAGSETWKSNSLSKGAARWAPGIAISKGKYESGFAPYREVIEGITLNPRGPKGDPANITRVAQIASALHEKKIQLQG